ncbi:Pectinesterase inhibitor 10 [Linum grandiflorum]
MNKTSATAAAIFSLIIFTTLLHLPISAAAAVGQATTATGDNFIKTSCNSTLYRKLCFRSLSPYSSEIRSDPKLLALKSLNITLKVTQSASKLMKRIARIPGVTGAAADCVEEVDDAVDALSKSIGELRGAPKGGGPGFCRVIDDVETFVSAAETFDETCIDGFEEAAGMAGGDSKVNRNARKIVEKRVKKVEKYTSNCLALVDLYASVEFRHVRC